jgi:nucleoside-diphosphate-sugar epimerase
MGGRHVVFGCSGPIGVALMKRLSAAGHEVIGVCRSGDSERPPGARIEAADVRDVETAARLAQGADVIYGCAGVAYTLWMDLWPGIVEGLLAAAESTDARLVFADNLYCYGAQNRPLTEDLPLTDYGRKPTLRAKLARTMLEADRVGRARVALVRASDFYGPGVTNAALGERVFPRLLAGKAVQLLGDPDVAHAFTYAPDFARALETVGAAEDEDFGQAWHVPNAPARTQREVITLLGELSGRQVKIRSLRRRMVALLALFSAMPRELKEMMHQWELPYRVDHSKWEARFGGEHTPLEDGLQATLEWYRSQR